MNRDIFAKVMRKSGRKSKYIMKGDEGGGPINLAKKNLVSNNLP